MKLIEIFTDGSCLGNPGTGGYGAIVRGLGEIDIELSGGDSYTTNNRMEMTAVYAAFAELNKHNLSDSKITVQTDSMLIVNTFTKNWKKKENKDIWAMIESEYVKLYSRNNQITFKWIKGHNGHIENERCDVLAKLAAGKN